jgi:YHS domain-containing protein
MGELQIQELIQSRNRVENVDITSPANGFILLRNVSDGQRFDKGTELFRIADLSRVWILVDVFERDASLVRSDQPVKLELPNQGRTFEARMTETLPQFDNITRTMKLRLEADNADFVLKPDMFVDVELPLSLAESLVVPAEAVLDAGLRQTVFVALGDGYFEPRRVQVGARLGEQVQITQGLKAGENIVVSGNFLLDSESRMKMAVAHAQDKAAIDPVCGMTLNKLTAVHTREIQGVLYYFCSEDCEKKFAAAPTKYQAKAELQRGAGSATMGASGRDPVCGMPVDEAKARSANLTSQWRGKTFWFCSPSCKKQFEIAPDKYLTPSASN